MAEKKGTPLWKALFIEHRLPWRYDNFLNTRIIPHVLHVYMKIIKGYDKFHVSEDISNMGSHIFIKNEGGQKILLKYPKRGNPTHNLLKKNEFNSYRDTLLSLGKIEFLNKNINKIIKIYNNGSYTSPFIEGYNLKSIHDSLDGLEINRGLRKDITAAIKDVIKSLDAYEKKYKVDYVSGDWYLHNLIYCANEKRIINVDLEGFYLYSGPGNSQNEIKQTKDSLNEVVLLLER